MKGTRPPAIPFIFVTIVLDVLAFGIIIPVLPRLIQQFMGGDTARAAGIIGIFGTMYAAMQFVCSPILGVLSDRFGRRPVILTALFGLGFDYILMALAPTVAWLFLGRVLSGITGASYTTAGAYIADVTPPKDRAAGYGLIGAAWGLGFVLGPALGGFLGDFDPRLPFWVAAALTLLNATYGFFILPESLPPERRKAPEWRRANPLGSLRLLRSHHGLLGLAGVYLLYFVAHQVMPAVFVLYTGYRYQWAGRTVGLALAAAGICGIVVQGFLVKRAVARFGERRTMLAGLCFGVLGSAIYGLAPTGGLFALGILAGAGAGLFTPSLMGLMTSAVEPSAQGQLQGATGSLQGLTGLIGPGLFSLTFASFIGASAPFHLPGAPFLLSGLLTLTALVLGWVVTGRVARR